MDFNMDKIMAAKQKYKTALTVYDPGYFGSVMLSYEDSDQSVNDVIKEFCIDTLDEYLDRERKYRDSHI